MSRVDGIHFGTGEDMSSGFFELQPPNSVTVINEPEAQWHYASIWGKYPHGLNVWRSSPAVSPAQVNYSAHLFSREVFKSIDVHWNRTGVYPTDILLLNELNLDYERGDPHNDGGAWDTNPANWPGLYQLLAGFLDQLLISCRERAQDRNFQPYWWFPAWAPGHGEYRPEIARIWTPVADKFDAVSLHSYTDADTITSDVLWYLNRFPDKEIGLFEWNTINKGEPKSAERYGEEVRIRSRLQALGRAYSQLSACYFIHAWAEDRSHEHDIKGNKQRTAIWDGRVEIPYDDWKPGPLSPPVDPVPEPEPEPVLPTPEEPPMPDYPLGIDISNNNGHVNMDEVAASGVKFVIAKLTEGVNFYDRYYMSFRTHAKRLGLKWGAYHYALPHLNNPNLEAAWFASNIEGTLEPGDIVALDLEDPKAFGDLSAWALQWCRSVEGLLGVKPLIYSSPAYITERKLKNRPELGEHGLWLASWGIPTPPPAPAPWDLVAIHQYGVGPSGTIPGVSGEIDLNHFNGPIEDFALYGLPGPVVEPDPDPVPPSDGYAIGQGIRDAMNSYGAAPASSEVPSEFWVEAMDTAGRIYRFVRATGITHAYSPNGEA